MLVCTKQPGISFRPYPTAVHRIIASGSIQVTGGHRSSYSSSRHTRSIAMAAQPAGAEQQRLVDDVLAHQQRLLDSIDQKDYATYEQLCSTDITCFEPETEGHLAEGLPFHKFFFQEDLAAAPKKMARSTISSPHVRLLGGGTVAVVSYVRLQQAMTHSPAGAATYQLGSAQETRVWEQQQGGGWKCVHLHRSKAA